MAGAVVVAGLEARPAKIVYNAPSLSVGLNTVVQLVLENTGTRDVDWELCNVPPHLNAYFSTSFCPASVAGYVARGRLSPNQQPYPVDNLIVGWRFVSDAAPKCLHILKNP